MESYLVPELNSYVQIRYTKGGRDIIEDRPKYSLISIHTSRRTTISKLSNNGVEFGTISFLSGHTNIAGMAPYIKPNEDKVLEKILEILNK